MASPNTSRKAPKTGNDLYNTPLNALEAAWNAGIFDRFQRYWDPCDGLGAISDFLEDRGKSVARSDIVSRRAECVQFDFLKPTVALYEAQCIVMNPPFTLSEQFIDHALTLCPNLIMFNRSAILETGSRTEKHMSGEWPLEKFWSFGNRVSCTEGTTKKKTSNSVWYGWYEYSKEYKGEPKIGWLFAENEKKKKEGCL